MCSWTSDCVRVHVCGYDPDPRALAAGAVGILVRLILQLFLQRLQLADLIGTVRDPLAYTVLIDCIRMLINRSGDSRPKATSDPVSTWMGDMGTPGVVLGL